MITFLVIMVAVLYVLGGVAFTAYVEKELGKLVSSFYLVVAFVIWPIFMAVTIIIFVSAETYTQGRDNLKRLFRG